MAKLIGNFDENDENPRNLITTCNTGPISFLCNAMMLLFYIFCVCTAIQTLYLLWMLWCSAATRSSKAWNPESQQGLSILLCAHNELDRLQISLPRLLEQKELNDFEIIVVDDASDDGTGAFLAEMAMKNQHLKIITIAATDHRTFPGKKFALSKGVAAAQYEQLLLCDADCYPASDNWARIMSAPLYCGKELVAGYGAYESYPGLLNAFIRWETLHTFLLYSSAGRSGLPYMAVGRNLACKKQLLLQAQQHPLWSSLPSGDDDLLIRITATRKNYVCISDPDAFTYSDAPDSMSSWLAQKQRHVSTGKLYRKSVQLLLALYAGSHGLMWISFIVLYCAGLGYLVSSMMLLRCVFAWSLWSTAATNLRERRLNLKLPLLDVFWLLYHLILSPYIFFKNKRQWT